MGVGGVQGKGEALIDTINRGWFPWEVHFGTGEYRLVAFFFSPVQAYGQYAQGSVENHSAADWPYRWLCPLLASRGRGFAPESLGKGACMGV